MECLVVLPTIQFAYTYWKVLAHVMWRDFVCLIHTVQNAAADFSAAFDGVNITEILYKLCCVGIGGSV